MTQPAVADRRSRAWKWPLFLILALLLAAPPFGVVQSAHKAEARRGGGFRGAVNRARQSVGRSVNQARQNFNRSVQRGRQNFNRAVQRGSQNARRSYQEEQRRAAEAGRRARENMARQQQIMRERARQQQIYIRRQAENAARQARQAAVNRTSAVSQMARQSYSRGAGRMRSGLLGGLSRGKDLGVRIRRNYGQRGVDAVIDLRNRFGQPAGAMAARLLARGKRGGMALLNSSAAAARRVGDGLSDPRVRNRVILGAMAAAAVLYYVHNNRDELKYKAIKYGLTHTQVTVAGRKQPLDQIISGALLDRAPYLKGTRMAEDPAAVLAYGVVAVGKEDLMNNVALAPDGRGGLCSVNQAVDRATGVDQAISALDMRTHLEGMAMKAAEDGDLGVYGQTFAGTYKQMEQNF